MNKITFPLKLRMQGPAVADLQDALKQCIDRGILRIDDLGRRELVALLQRERSIETYGEGTRRLVSLFQEARQLPASGAVDEPTAQALNVLLREWGLLAAEGEGTQMRIEGRIVSRYGVPIEQLKLRLYRLDFGGKATQLGETTTLAGGQYSFTFDPGPTLTSLQVRAVNAANKEITLSKPLNNLGATAKVNLVAPDELQAAAPAEFSRLATDLTTHVGAMNALAGAKENDERQDLTVLNRATGWDARVIALAATAQRLSADPDLELPAEAVYGLLRAGLPSDKATLALVDPDSAEQALKAVSKAGVVALDEGQIASAKKQFSTFAAKVRLETPAPGSRSTYGELLNASGASDDAKTKFAPVFLLHGADASQLWAEARKAKVAEKDISKLQLHGKLAFLAGNSGGMTARLMQKRISDPVQLVEQDFHLPGTWANEVLDQAGIPANRRNNLTDADKKKLEAEIPTAYTAEKVEDRLAAYAGDMARKVRLSYPTQVVGRAIEKGELRLPAAGAATATLMKNSAGQGFRLGETPVNAFLKTHVGVRQGMAEKDFKAAQTQMKTLQRVYQITPSNEAMPVLMSLGMTSAFDVMAYSEIEFRTLYDRKYFELHGHTPPAAEAALVYRKSKQVSSVTYNLFVIAKKLDTEAPVAAISAPAEVRESVRNELVKQYPTMESLFGSMDFCECDHCRTVLSPAAYLVDLLQFVDAEPEVWGNFLAQWKATHGNQDYPHKDKDGNPLKPYDVLEARRPDLPHIPLTCENTHTALPYIDVVNEILEYYVANGRLADKAAHDTGDATTEELLAEPQNVIAGAYEKLREARYPLALPFDLWIETVRQFANYFETPLARVLEVFRPGDDLFAPGQPFDRSAIFMESLGLSPTDVAIFTDPDPLANDKWHELYGLPTVRSAIQNPTNAVHATVTVPNADAGKFREGLACAYFDVSANALSAESKTISGIGAADSGGPGRTTITFTGIWTAPPVANDLLLCNAREMLRSAKTLSRALGVTYKEIAEIVQTDFVNPKLAALGVLSNLGVSIHDARFYLQHKALEAQDPTTLSTEDQKRRLEVVAFSAELVKLAEKFNVPRAQLETALQAVPFAGTLVLADPEAGCDFDLTTLQFADGAPADATVFLRINLFVRLWRKLGWTIEETDRALQAFVPSTTPFETAHLSKQPLKTALIYLAHLNALNEKLRVGSQSRIKLATLWSDISAKGKKPLYAQLFLTRRVLNSSPAFDHPLGQYLSAAGVKIKDHVLALQGALGLTADDIGRILEDAGKSLATADLTIPHVSLVYRYGLPAKALKLSVRELIGLKQLSGLDPFTPLHASPLADTLPGVIPAKKAIELDHPFSQTLKFVEVAEAVKESGLKVEDLDYLLRHRLDETGKYRPNREGNLALLKTLAEGIRAIRAEHAIPDDPGALSEEVLRQKLGLALPADVVETFLAMLNGSAQVMVSATGVASADQLKPAAFTDEPMIRDLIYIETPQRQKLTFRGVLVDAEKTALKARLPKPAEGAQHVPSAVLSQLLDAVQLLQKSFFEKHLRKQVNVQPASGFLEPADYNGLFDRITALPLPANPTEQDRKRAEQNWERQRLVTLANAFLPFLQARLIRQFVVQTMTAHTGADPALVESLLTDARLLGGVKPLLEAFVATGERGISADFFESVDGSGARQPTPATVSDADTALKPKKDAANNNLNAATSARFEGYLEVPTPGAYRFHVALDKQDAEMELRFDHLPNPVFLKGVAAADRAVFGEQPLEFLELKAGIPYRFALVVKKLNGGGARLLVQGETLPLGGISQLALYPAMKDAEAAIVLLTKVLQIVQTLGLSERATRYLLTHAAAFGDLKLSDLPTKAVGGATAAEIAAAIAAEAIAAKKLFAQFLRLAAYARLQRDLAGGTDDLIAIFEANGTTEADRLVKKVYPLLARLTRRDEAAIKATAEALVAAPAFDSEKPLQRLWEALQIVERFGVPVAVITKWTSIVSPAATPAQRAEIARDLKEAIKARFEPEAWHRVAQPIFDRLRQRQRDGLAAFVMHQHRFARLEQLYEYFLIDPGMEPVVQTSRIRLAIASVQLFIQRCLLNMEHQVNPSVINSRQWEWMKRYRVWEANRKIFLFPENWLEPEFRDDKTHLFAELEGALLQGDVSSDLVEDAFLAYLKKLDELARLDIAAMHLEDNADPALRTLHVIGRTYATPHKFFYRRYAHQMWTPWEPVGAEVEGDHLAPVVWRDRLYLFWVTFLEKPGRANSSVTIDPTKAITIPPVQTVVEVQLHWSEYLQGEWNTRESSGFDAPDPIVTAPASSFNGKSVFIHVSKAYEDGEERGVYVHLGGTVNHAFHLAGRNSAPEKQGYTANSPRGVKPDNPFNSAAAPRANRYAGSGAFKVLFQERITTAPGQTPPKANPSVLAKGGAYTLLPCDNNLTALGVSEDAFAGATDPAAVKAAIESGLGEIATLMKPVFYQDNKHTLFVEPNVTERTVEEWEEWVITTPAPEPGWRDPDWWRDIGIIPERPRKWPVPDPWDPRAGLQIDPGSLIYPARNQDWLVNPGTALLFDGAVIGPRGRPGLEVTTVMGMQAGTPVNVSAGSNLVSGSTIVLTRGSTLENEGLTHVTGGLNVVSGSGFNSVLKENLDLSNQKGFGAGMAGL